jgi:hypothetical protein
VNVNWDQISNDAIHFENLIKEITSKGGLDYLPRERSS